MADPGGVMEAGVPAFRVNDYVIMDWQRCASSCIEPEKGIANNTTVKSLLWMLVKSRKDINLDCLFKNVVKSIFDSRGTI